MSHSFSAGTNFPSEDFYSLTKKCVFLVVDDFESMRKITINQLRQQGAVHVMEAANGAEALKVIATHNIDVVLSDWNMPVMTGLELLLKLRTSQRFFNLPFMMITAEAERDRVIQAVRAGVSELIVKPYSVGRFAERLDKTLHWKSKSGKPMDSGYAAEVLKGALADSSGNFDENKEARKIHVKPYQKPTILIVDDTLDNLDLLSELFMDDYRVLVANNGAKALTISRADNPPDLVLLDVMMPGMDGFDVARQLRDHPSTSNIPVIFVTALTDSESLSKGMDLGAVDFVSKPINPVALKIKINNFMRYIDLHRKLQAEYDQIIEVEHLKEDVNRITRHDMKGPLAGIVGMAQSILEAETYGMEQREQVRMIEEAAFQVLNLINLSNEIFKIETGSYQLKPVSVALGKIVGKIVELMKNAFSVKGLIINIENDDGTGMAEFESTGEATFCYSIFQNLLKNACEAAPANTSILIKLVTRENCRQVDIENSGAVPLEIRENFFDKFVTAGKEGGTGIGTYSARLLVKAQGGDISLSVDDKLKKTKISVRLPMNTL